MSGMLIPQSDCSRKLSVSPVMMNGYLFSLRRRKKEKPVSRRHSSIYDRIQSIYDAYADLSGEEKEEEEGSDEMF